jgi:hypothetical protein
MDSLAPLVFRIRSGEVMGQSFGGAPPARRVFIAYRMGIESSEKMRSDIEALLRKRAIVAVDGRVDSADVWAPTIRKRIASAKLLLADVTGPSREVIFEVGFASGKHLLPIVEDGVDRSRVPRWLSTVQMSAFKGAGLPAIASRIDAMLSAGRDRPRRRPKPRPGSIVWLQSSDAHWADSVRERVELLCREYGLELLVVDADDLGSPEDLDEILRCWLAICLIDGGPQDYLSHFIMGDIVARRKSGSGQGKGQSIDRNAIVVCDSEETRQSRVADSARRVSRQVLAPASLAQLIPILKPKLDNYKNWLNRPLGD